MRLTIISGNYPRAVSIQGKRPWMGPSESCWRKLDIARPSGRKLCSSIPAPAFWTRRTELASTWPQAQFFYPSPGFLDETMTVYLARGLTAGDAQPEEDESIECQLTPLSEALAMVRSGEICDGKTIASVLWLAENLRS